MNALPWLQRQALGLNGSGWEDAVGEFLCSEAGMVLCQRIDMREIQHTSIIPHDPFLALKLTPLRSVKVVILGQDPYHGEGQATGLAFAVQPGTATPPSLRNIFKELGMWGPERRHRGDLSGWAEQGVLLLNTVLTVEQDAPAAHAGWGWETLTDALIERCANTQNCVFMLWGAHAQSKLVRLNARDHLVLTCSHPSPLSATRGANPFMGSGVFSAANAWLIAQGQAPIDWRQTEKKSSSA